MIDLIWFVVPYHHSYGDLVPIFSCENVFLAVILKFCCHDSANVAATGININAILPEVLSGWATQVLSHFSRKLYFHVSSPIKPVLH